MANQKRRAFRAKAPWFPTDMGRNSVSERIAAEEGSSLLA